MSTPPNAIRITCPVCKVRIPIDSTVCPDCGQNLAVLVREVRRVDILFNEGLAAIRAGDEATAVRRLEDALSLAPQRIDVLDTLARLYLRRGLRTDALAAWKRILELAPDNAAAGNAVRDLQAALDRARNDALTQTRNAARRRRRTIIGVAAASLAGGMLAAAGAFVVLRPPPAPPPPAALPTTTPAPTATPPPTHTPLPTSTTPASTATPQPSPTTALPTSTSLPTTTPLPNYAALVRDALAPFAIQDLDVSQDGRFVVVRGAVAVLADKDNAESAARTALIGGDGRLSSELSIAATYEVKPGDTLYKIAARVNRNARAIAAENKIALDAVLRAGTLLLIPKQ